MAYGVRYEGRFTNTAGNQYAVQLLQKNYSGDVVDILLAGNPVKHTWQTDEPKAPIKGSSLVLTLINPGGEESTNLFDAVAYPIYDPMGTSYIILTTTAFVPEVGVTFTISGHSDPAINTTFNPVSVIPTGTDSYFVYVSPGEITAFSSPDTVTILRSGNLLPGALPITTFYSPNDDEWKIRFFREPSPLSVKLFEGFLVQDDCSELMVDYIHEISLSFTDNLGLLKDIALDANVPDFGGYPATANFTFDSGTGDCFIYLFNTDFVPEVGVDFTTTRHINGSGNGTWTPIAVSSNGDRGWVVQVADLSFIDIEAWPVIITGAGTINLLNKNTLLNIIRVCLYNTGLELNTLVYANIFENTHSIYDSFLTQTYIETTSLLNNDNFINCYEVLTKILDRWNLTLFQSLGRWNIVRWDEARYGAIPFFLYDTDFIMQQTGDFNNFFTTGFEQDTYPENGLLRSIFRPYKYDKETFNYVQPESLILNNNLQELGDFISSSSAGGFTYDKYEFPETSKWSHLFAGQTDIDTSYIVVVTNNTTGTESDRYVFQPKTNTSGGVGINYQANVQFNDIQVSAGDVMDFDIKIKSDQPDGDNVLWRFAFILVEDEGSYWGLDTPGGNWTHFFSAPNTEGFVSQSVTVLSAEIENYLDYKLSTQITSGKVQKFPVDGVLRIRVYGSNTTNASQPDVNAIWKDIKLTITQNINDSTRIKGHVHNTDQAETIKNNEDIEIFLDDSPRSTIAGSLYTVNHSGLVQLKTTKWYRLTNPSELLRIGEITTFEQLFWRRVPRTKQDGTFYGIAIPADTLDISMLSILKNVAFNELNFIFGMLEIDYKNNNFSGTQWELYEDGEVDGDLGDNYTFTYLYDSK